MKKVGLLLLTVAMLCSCCGNKELKRVATGEPILPIREAGDTTEVYLTDYLPSLDVLQIKDVRVTDGYDSLTVSDGVLTLFGAAGTVGVLSVVDGSCQVDIPILPKLPVVQGLTTQGIKDSQLLLKADAALQPLRFRCFVQNMLLPEEALSSLQDGTYGIDLNRLPKQQGRSYLRVFACNDTVQLNDLLIPLEDGSPVVDASRLSRHDANAQVLYSLLVDRFFNGNTGNDEALNSPEVDERVDYKGGDLKGITAKIQEGFFDSLGINTLWISPITQNPKDAWGQYHNPDTKFSG